METLTFAFAFVLGAAAALGLDRLARRASEPAPKARFTLLPPRAIDPTWRRRARRGLRASCRRAGARLLERGEDRGRR